MKKINSLSLSISILISTALFTFIFHINEFKKRENAVEISKDEIHMANKIYKGTRRRDCSEIFKIEKEAFNNTKTHYYNSYEDACIIEYKGTDGENFTKEF